MLRSPKPPVAYILGVDNVRGDRVLHWLMRTVMCGPNEAEKLSERKVILTGGAAYATPTLGEEGANIVI